MNEKLFDRLMKEFSDLLPWATGGTIVESLAKICGQEATQIAKDAQDGCECADKVSERICAHFGLGS